MESLIKDISEVTPLRGRILLEEFEHKEKVGRIIVPQTKKHKTHIGKVLKVGNAGFDVHGNIIPTELKEGDIVVYYKYLEGELPPEILDTEKYYLAKERDEIICRIRRE